MRRTRIVATLGPSTDPPSVLRAIIEAGMDVARINFSHGSAEEHVQRVATLRQMAQELRRNVAVLADLPGPKLRAKMLAPLRLNINDTIRFCLDQNRNAPEDICLTEPEILSDVKIGQRILLDDGRLQCVADRFEKNALVARVIVGGELLPNKGINLPDTALTISPITDRDRQAMQIAAQAGADWLALSFVRSPESAQELRAQAREFGLGAIPILAKIERPEAVEHAQAIIDAFDGIMVARGDLGVEIPLEKVPTVQKRLIALSRVAGKPVITATDMLDSMRKNPRPTRAESGDVANAIYDGTDAVMLSGETAVGDYPIVSVQCMSNIAIEAESHLAEHGHPVTALKLSEYTIDDLITETVVNLANRIQADAIVTPTLSGRTARLIARHRPKAKIIAPAPNEMVLRQMAVVWGLQPVLMDYCRRAGDDRLTGAVTAAFAQHAIREGELLIVLAGHPVEGGTHSPTIRLVRVGENGQAVEP
ncbi:MAG: pyruvate kinase [Gemmataceae bacterium]|nr:pyruvate kinase [Gemmataceae bacterium]